MTFEEVTTQPVGDNDVGIIIDPQGNWRAFIPAHMLNDEENALDNPQFLTLLALVLFAKGSDNLSRFRQEISEELARTLNLFATTDE